MRLVICRTITEISRQTTPTLVLSETANHDHLIVVQPFVHERSAQAKE